MLCKSGGRWASIILFMVVAPLIMLPPTAQADLDDICQTCYNMVNRIFPPAPKEDIEKYRKSWNPFAAGPMLNPAIDIQPQGQTVIHPYFFGTIGHQQFGNKFGTNTSNSPTHLSASLMLLPIEYGVTDSMEASVAFSFIDWFATQQNFNPENTHNAMDSEIPRSFSNTDPLSRIRIAGVPR